MKTAQKKAPEELRMSSAEFDRIMGQALQVKPKVAKSKTRPTAKKRRRAKAKPNKVGG